MRRDELSADELDQLVAAMDNDGYGVIREYFSEQEVDEASQFVFKQYVKHKSECFFYNGPEPVAGTLMAELGGSLVFRRTLARIYERVVGKEAPSSKIYQALRVVSGQSGLEHSWKFHYDSYVITALVPIIIPSGSSSFRGDLILYPKLRDIRESVMANLIDKTAFQNRLVRHLMATNLIQRLLNARVLLMKPRSIYFFRGYESLHANKPCSPDVLRCTALFHYADPNENSSVFRMIRNGRQRRRMSNPCSSGNPSSAN